MDTHPRIRHAFDYRTPHIGTLSIRHEL